MKAFRFSLQRVLEWRAVQLRTEEEKLSALQHQLGSLLIRDKELQASLVKSELELRSRLLIPAVEIAALSGFRKRIEAQRRDLRVACFKVEREIDAQRKKLLDARRDHRMLEKLREKKYAEWTYLNDRELESVAADAFLAQWARPE